MYILKQIPEDFIVEEEMSLLFKEEGEYTYYKLKKKEKTTIEALDQLTKAWRLGKKSIGFAGNKDKHALTTQYISLFHGPKKNFEAPNISVTLVGTGDEPISLGTNGGNKFVITVRNVTKQPEQRKWFINYFDQQRFSTNNVEIGKAIVTKRFEDAVLLLKKSNREYEKRFTKVLEESNKNYIQALLTTPKKILSLLINAYQSDLWNKTTALYLAEKKNSFVDGFLIPLEEVENTKIPLIGFGTEVTSEKIKKIIDALLAEEKIDKRDFIIRQLPNMSSEGGERDLITEIQDLQISEANTDTLHEGMKKVTVSFHLQKGSYATMAIRHLFWQEYLEK